LKLLYFSRDYTPHDHRFLAALARTEHQVYYLRLERREPQVEDRPLPPEVEIIPWSGGQSPARLQDGSRLWFDLKRILHHLKPDLVHAGPVQRSAFLVALSGYRPLVSMSWGYDLIHDAQRGVAWRWATRYTLQRSAALVGDSEIIRRLAVSYGMPEERIVTFPWGIDLEHFSPAGRERPSPENASAPFTLLSTRSWEALYGVETIAQAFVLAAQQRPELRLVMLGGGSQAGRLRQILSSVEKFPQPNQGNVYRVLTPGQIGYADLPRYYRSADLYLSASYSDGASISLLEAMACGCPVLVSDIPGNREWVTPGVNGWLFPPGDANALAQAILRAVEQRGQLPRLGAAARQLAEARADWNKNFPQLLRAYQLALETS